ncbi:hypothetical protein K2173_004650 [Erythroxylum novogranatense]|uniref:Hexosyltransferase n=1 Tax=Erythroxylum novogranatense TaxID=1862640 RepID=A0AAV8T4U5_9ROSI|nr:hypothetical protein K2173_004650 [Erythroxylum novogranatense]
MVTKTRGGVNEGAARNAIPRNLALLLWLSSFFVGMFFTNRMWIVPEGKVLEPEGCKLELTAVKQKFNNLWQVSKRQYDFRTLDDKITNLEMKLAAAKAEHQSLLNGPPPSRNVTRKYFMVIGIYTAFSSRKRRDSVRATWMPQGKDRKKLEKEKGVIIRFVIGHSTTTGGVLDKAIDEEEMVHGDFMKLEHAEGYLELSAKTKTYFATAVALWDAEFYVKVDDDIHVNLGILATILSGHRMKPRVYIGCMKYGPVVAKIGVKYHEPEHWKFGVLGNSYFRHAAGQIYAISKDLAAYISANQHVLHKYANEDVSLGSWFIGLDIRHVDEKRLCCGITPADCMWKAQVEINCAAAFDWKCGGICNSVDRMVEVHKRCGEDQNAIWSAAL